MKMAIDEETPPEVVEESDEEFEAFFASPLLVHYVGMLKPARPGVTDCFKLLEHSYFKPGTSRNVLFSIRVIEWMDMIWGIVSIPIEEKHFMEKAAQASYLLVANGIPNVIANGEIFKFPINNDRVFTLENIPGHPMYSGGIRQG
jgi:hypothetical protein